MHFDFVAASFDIVAPDLDFVAGDFVFVAPDLDFVARNAYPNG
jgi:hypothetical protein